MSTTGKCLCGQASYQISGEPLVTALCHCRNCQRQSGSAFSINMGFPTDMVKLTGEVKIYHDTAERGATVLRKFCPECGSPLLSLIADAPQITYVKGGTLDNGDAVTPQLNIWCKSAQPWFRLDPDMPQFDENPPLAG